MKKLAINLENCHGIRRLSAEIDFHGKRAVSIYAPNGTMKTSFARSFQDLAKAQDSADAVFPDRVAVRTIVDEQAEEIAPNDVVVILSYDEDLGPTEATSTLLVNPGLRKEYETLQLDLLAARDELAAALKAQAGTRRDVLTAISSTFTSQSDAFFRALTRIEEELHEQTQMPFASIPYDVIFNDKVLQLMRTDDFKSALTDYVTRLNQLLDDSKFFSRDTFNYYNATTVTKSLGDNGFFSANHKLLLSGADGDPVEIADANQLEMLVVEETKRITNDTALAKKLAGIEKALNRNVEARTFWRYIAAHDELLPELANVDLFAEKVWKSYLKTHEVLYDTVIMCYRSSEDRKLEIETQAADERTQWERVIEIFNERFFVPFVLTAKNRDRVVLGQESVLQLGFEFRDGIERAALERGDLLEVLSTGEKKALYILNVLFEVEARKSSGSETLFVIDDIADSFDYKNKYAIIHYLKEMSEQGNFRLIVLTHNFDFFRTLQSRAVVAYPNCLMAQRGPERVTLEPAKGIKNPFIYDFKPHFFDDALKRVASIPFVRNIAEYTKGEDDPDYVALTSLLHWKTETESLTQGRLDSIFSSVFGGGGGWTDPDEPVVELVLRLAEAALQADEGINFEYKIVLSIAIRLLAERHMIAMIADASATSGIVANQTQALFRLYRERGLGVPETVAVLDAVVLMTPENLHINSFMYEPIIDMSDSHLRRLFQDVLGIDSLEAEVAA